MLPEEPPSYTKLLSCRLLVSSNDAGAASRSNEFHNKENSMGSNLSKEDDRVLCRRTQSDGQAVNSRSLSTDSSAEVASLAGSAALKSSFSEDPAANIARRTNPPLVLRQRDHALLKSLHTFQAATFTLGQPARVSIIAFVVLVLSEDPASKVHALEEFPFIEVETSGLKEFRWVFEEWKELVKAVQTQLGGHVLSREKNTENITAIRAVPDSHAREFIKDCLRVSESFAQGLTLNNLQRVATLVSEEELTDQAFVNELEWTGALSVLTNLA